MDILLTISDKYGMVLGSGIGDISQRSVAAFGKHAWAGIGIATGYIFVVSLAISRLFALQPNRASLTLILRSSIPTRIVSVYTLLTALTFTCGGLHVADSAVNLDQFPMIARFGFVMSIMATASLMMWYCRHHVDSFTQWSGLLEFVRYVLIFLGCLTQLLKADRRSSFEMQQSQVSVVEEAHGAKVLNAILAAIFAFAGFESAAQSVNSPREVSLVICITVLLAGFTYMLTAQAVWEFMGHGVHNTDKTQILPQLAADAWNMFFGGGIGSDITYVLTCLVQVITVVNGAVGCVRYASELVEDTAAAGDLGSLSNSLQRTPQRSPSALFVLTAALGLWASGQYAGLLETFATMNTITHAFSALALVQLACARRSLPDMALGLLCVMLALCVLVSVLVLEESVGLTAIIMVVACTAATFL